VVHAVTRVPIGVAHSNERKATRNALLVEREILAAHDRFHVANVLGADEAFRGALRDVPR